MRLNRFYNSLVAAAFCVASVPAMAANLVWDWSPETTGGTVTHNNWTNTNPGQHFGEQVSFSSDTFINEMDIYSGDAFGHLGDNVVVTIWGDAGSQPGAVLAQFFTTISDLDLLGATQGNNRKHADFSGFMMMANISYWIGMSGDGIDIVQTGLQNVAGGNSRMAQFNGGDTFGVFTGTGVGDMAFRLYSDVPEPATLALFAFGLAGLGATRRKKAS